jgi:basic membrane protein A and related proteins
MKKLALVVAIMLMVSMLAVGCTAGGGNKYGMVTDAGTIDDKSFNQGTWEGLEKAGKEFNFEPKYLKPANAQPAEADYMTQIDALYSAGYKFIVLPGFKFSTAVDKEQVKYKDAKFVCIDYEPADANGKVTVGPNTVAIYYNEHESGFLAGVATALQLKEGEIGFIGGMQIPAVQKFNWGFQQGVKYANDNLGTKIVIKAENVIYDGTFTNVAGGQQEAALMFDKGVKAIFCAAGGVGVGAINEAMARVKQGKEAWIIGVDVDQYTSGIYDTAANKSVILTSAMKGVTMAAYDMVKANKDGKFPGGQTLTYNAKNGGVGIPATNPNLTKEVSDQVATVFKDLQDGKIVVADKADGLIEPAAK